jgi:eukaryotic-like serine/threonine-protein kinase
MISSEGPHLAAGRYVLFDEIAAGVMGSVHIGRQRGSIGFARTVAIKRLHSRFARDRGFVARLLDETRLAMRIQHPNVVSTLDVSVVGKEVFVVLEYVHGQSLSALLTALSQRQERVPVPVALGIMRGVLAGLHAAHETRDGRDSLGILHGDVSPQNILVGAHGVAKLAEFGVAKAKARAGGSSREVGPKGELAYQSPEQLRGDELDRRADVYSAAVVLWELLAGRRLFSADEPALIAVAVQGQSVEAPSRHVPGIAPALDALVLRGLARERDQRFATADALARAVGSTGTVASEREIGRWVETVAGEALSARASLVADVERLAPVEATLSAQALLEGMTEAPSLAPEAPVYARAPKTERQSFWLLAPAVLAVVGFGMLALARPETRGEVPAARAPEGARLSVDPEPPRTVSEPDREPVPAVSSTSAVHDSDAAADCDVPASCRPPYRTLAGDPQDLKPECQPFARCFDR